MAKPMSFSDTTRKAIIAKGNHCWACGLPGWAGIEVDHIIPRNHPDCTTNESNGQMLCSNCNIIKSDTIYAITCPVKSVWFANETKMRQIITKNRCEFRKIITSIRRGI